GNPWLMRDIVDALVHKKEVAESTVTSLTFAEKIPVILQHCALAVETKGEQRGMLEMRKHLASYVKGFDGASALRSELVQVERLEQVQSILCAA
ncbi:tRNA dihydrouridine synthase DusB, partial [Candidatus Peregrinibacteria bacterium CG10_big_fil_rev_8_21_14_0_10_49_10]